MLITGRFPDEAEATSFVYEVPKQFAYSYDFMFPEFPPYAEAMEFIANHDMGDQDVCVVVNCFGKIRPEDTSWYKVVALIFASLENQVLAKLHFGRGFLAPYDASGNPTATE